MHIEKHEFAFYIEYADKLNEEFIIDDELLLHRFKDIIRLNVHDIIVLFNQSVHVRAQVLSLQKKSITFKRLFKERNKILKPHITFLFPLLKKEALLDAIYSMAELGANEIQLVITKKVQRPWIEKELDRLKKVIIAAAEQSKNFAFPQLYSPKNLSLILEELKPNSERIFFAQESAKISELINSLEDKNITTVYLIVGPEGDLAQEEKELLAKRAFSSYSLTQTVLRSQQAAAIGLGLIRSLL